jgi:hypothetical protein
MMKTKIKEITKGWEGSDEYEAMAKLFLHFI